VIADEGLIVSRFIHYSALLFAFGVCFFPAYAFRGAERQRTLDYWNKQEGYIRAGGLIAFVSGLSWLFFTAATMTDSLSEALKPETMSAVLGETEFGVVWSIHLGLIAALVVLALLDRRRPLPRTLLLTLLSAACLASLAGVGHAQMQEGPAFFVRAAADGAHLLAAGAWLGALIPLFVLLTPRPHPDANWEIEIGGVLMRFSGMVSIAVAVLIATGMVNSLFSLNSLSEMLTSLYGQLLFIKLGLFALLLVLAAVNRFWLVPQILASGGGQHGKAFLLRLRRHVLWEEILGVVIIALVSVLGALSPSQGQ
jgi:putative copper resistance protein D